MSKHIIEFELPEEQSELNTTLQANNYKRALDDLRTFFRNQLKYADLPDKQYKIYDEINSKFWAILEDNEIDDV